VLMVYIDLYRLSYVVASFISHFLVRRHVINSETLHKNKIKQMAVIYRILQQQQQQQLLSSRNISKDTDLIRSSNNVLNKHLTEILSVSLP